MLPVHGFYGHVRHNDMLSVAMFAGFLLALQLLAAVVLFLPLLLFDVDHAPIYNFAGYARRYASLTCAAGAALFLVQFFLHVRWVRVSADFTYIDRLAQRRLVNIVETLAIGAGLPYPRIGMIDTDARNAFACGLSPASAVVVVTRGLVESLDDDELAAVIAHEIAHIRNGDIRLMAAANVMLGNLLYLQQNSLLRIVDWRQVMLFVVVPPFLLLFLIGGFVSGLALLIARVSRLLVSSSRELIADAEAVRMTHNPSALISALRRIDGHSTVPGIGPETDAMMIDGASFGALATHPTISERIAILTRLSGDMVMHVPRRNDVRTFGQRASGQQAVFGRRAIATPAITPPRDLVGRVNEDFGLSSFGVAPGLGGLLLLGLAGMVLMYPNDFKSVRGIMARFDPTVLRAMSDPALKGTFRYIGKTGAVDRRL